MNQAVDLSEYFIENRIREYNDEKLGKVVEFLNKDKTIDYVYLQDQAASLLDVRVNR